MWPRPGVKARRFRRRAAGFRLESRLAPNHGAPQSWAGMNEMARAGGAENPGPADTERRTGRLAYGVIAVLLLTAAVLRFLLVAGGGQFFFPDESRYSVSRDAAAQLAAGNVKAGLLLPFGNSEHPGFKFLGLAPALLEQWVGRNDRIPALYFSIFSLLVVVLIWLATRRLGAPPGGQAAATFLAVASSSLLCYSRHLFPYDPSLAFALAAWYVGLKRGGWARRVTVGLLAGAALVTYLGYWSLVGTVLFLHVVQPGDRRERGRRALAAAAGAGAVVAAVGLLIRLATGSALVDALRFATTVNQGDFREGYRLVWRYLAVTDGFLLWLWLAAAAYAIVWCWRHRRDASERVAPVVLCLTGLLTLYAALVFAANGLEKFVVYGRVARLLVPFFCVLAGLVAPLLGPGRRWRRPLLAALALVIAVSAAARFRQPLTQMFPRDFRVRGDALLGRLPSVGPNAYYRYVNVIHYVHGLERLRQPPAETLLAAPHPYQYAPYLYEGFTAAERRARLSPDQAMRLVRMVVPPEEQLAGQPYGIVTLRLRLPTGRGGFTEPLLSIGSRRDGELFFVRYEAGARVVFGFESMGNMVVTADPVDVAPQQDHVLRLFSGGLAPPGEQPVDGVSPDYYRRLVYLSLDGHELIHTFAPGHRAGPDEVFVGVNAVEADSAGDQFWGDVFAARRGGLPPGPTGGAEWPGDFGAVELTLLLPAVGPGVPEPLVVAGIPGRGVLGFVKNLPDGTHEFGVEVWSVGAWAGRPVHVRGGKTATVVYSFGSLFPPSGAAAWGATPPERQRALKDEIRITVDGVEVFEATRRTPEFDHVPLYVGVNPIGGSYVGARFSGEMLASRRLPIAGNAAPAKSPP